MDIQYGILKFSFLGMLGARDREVEEEEEEEASGRGLNEDTQAWVAM